MTDTKEMTAEEREEWRRADIALDSLGYIDAEPYMIRMMMKILREAAQREREQCATFAEKSVGRLTGIGIANALRLGQHYPRQRGEG